MAVSIPDGSDIIQMYVRMAREHLGLQKPTTANLEEYRMPLIFMWSMFRDFQKKEVEEQLGEHFSALLARLGLTGK